MSLRDTDWDPGLPPESDFSVRLTEAQLESFHRDGFTSIPRITTDEEIEWLKPIYDHLFDTKGSFKGGYFDLARKYDAEGDDLVPQVLAPDRAVAAATEDHARAQRARDRAAVDGLAAGSDQAVGPHDPQARPDRR